MIYDIDDLNQSIQIALSQTKERMKNLTTYTETEISLAHSQLKKTVKQILNEKFESNLEKIRSLSGELSKNEIISKEDLLSAQIEIDKALTNLQISPPIFREELSIFNLTLTSCIGGLMMSAAISPIFVYLFHFPDTFSNLLSVLIGMSISLIFGIRLTQDIYVRRMLAFFLGGSLVVEALFVMQSALTFAAFRGLIGSKLPTLSIFKRLALYGIGFLFLNLSKKETMIDLDQYLHQIEIEIKQSLYQVYQENLNHFFKLQQQKQAELEDQSHQLAIQRKQESSLELMNFRKHYTGLASKLIELHACELDQLPFMCSELIQLGRLQGISGLDGYASFEIKTKKDKQIDHTDTHVDTHVDTMGIEAMGIAMDIDAISTVQTFAWQAEFENRYDRFGSINIGDLVFIEKETTMMAEQILEKGLVRKVRTSK